MIGLLGTEFMLLIMKASTIIVLSHPSVLAVHNQFASQTRRLIMPRSCMTSVACDKSPSLIRDEFIARTQKFVIRPSLDEGMNAEDDIIKSARRYYLLLPKDAVDCDWLVMNKGKRRAIILKHLNSVCDSVESHHIKEVDLWLTTRASGRDSLTRYGRQLQEQYGRLCFVCGRKIEHGLTVDHIYPFSKGGATKLENLILAHGDCNSAKGGSLPGEFVRWAPKRLSDNLEEIDKRLMYLAFLRDNFTCQVPHCDAGLFSGVEITLALRHPTGIPCYDNLETMCMNCAGNDC